MGEKEKIKHIIINLNDIKPIKMTFIDLKQIIEIYKSIWGERGIYDPLTFMETMSQGLSYVYKIEDEVIAFCLVEYINENNIIEIVLLCVKEEYRHNHLGKSLLSFCINNCRSKKYNRFSLHVSTTNIPALNLYKKLGFVIKQCIKQYYNDEDPKANDAYYMTLGT